MYFGATPFSASAFSDVGFNPNAFVGVEGIRLNVGIGNAQASIPKDVPVTGNGFEIGNSTVTTKAGAVPPITGIRANIATGAVSIIGKCNLTVTGSGFEVALGNATAKANATAIVSGKGFTVSTSDVTVVAKAKALPSGEGFKIGTSDITIRQWDQVPVNATQTWRKLP
jgi:hypothetical protein